MKKQQQFSTAISNEEHLAKAKDVYNNEVRPNLDENQKAYRKYVQDKKVLSLSPAQKTIIF